MVTSRSAITVETDTAIEVGPLPHADAVELAASILGGEPGLIERAVDRARGNPMFIEELARTATDLDNEIPDSLVDLLTARLDSLGPARRYAQLAAVVGASFSTDEVDRLGSFPPEKARSLRQVLVDNAVLIADAEAPREPVQTCVVR